MSDTTTPAADAIGSIDIAADISRMVSQRESATVRTTRGASGSYNTSTGELKVTPGDDGGIIADSGRDVIADLNLVIDQHNALIADTAKVTGYDEAGQPQYVFTASERAAKAARAQSLAASIEYQRTVADRILAQREATKAAKAQTQAEEAAAFAFTQGDARKAQLLKDAIDAETAKLAAQAIVSARRR